jgi:hypothetical protein
MNYSMNKVHLGKDHYPNLYSSKNMERRDTEPLVNDPQEKSEKHPMTICKASLFFLPFLLFFLPFLLFFTLSFTLQLLKELGLLSNLNDLYKIILAAIDSLLFVLVMLAFVLLYCNLESFDGMGQLPSRPVAYYMFFPIASFVMTMTTLLTNPDASTEINITGMVSSTIGIILIAVLLYALSCETQKKKGRSQLD